MMTDPKYMTDEASDASEFERELLQAAQSVQLSADEKQAIWAGVALQALPALSAAPSVAPAAAASKAALGLTPLLKGALLILGLGGLSAAGYWLSHAPARAPSVRLTVNTALAAPSAAPNSPEVPVSAGQPAAPPSASAREASPLPPIRDASANDKKSALSDESGAVLEIRRTLRAGDAASALRLLEQARQRFPNGALSQEREALSIEALAKSGAGAAAARKARAFLRAYPKSPYASDVRSFAAE
jgi:hypothetical protein